MTDSNYVAIGKDGVVSILCSVRKNNEDGSIRFWVENGAWEGTFYPNGDVYVHETNQTYSGNEILWESDTLSLHYNEAIREINESLKK